MITLYNKGYNYKSAKNKAKELNKNNPQNLRFTYGTRTQKFHIIDKLDRDYDRFDLRPSEFKETRTKKQAISRISGSRFI